MLCVMYCMRLWLGAPRSAGAALPAPTNSGCRWWWFCVAADAALGCMGGPLWGQHAPRAQPAPQLHSSTRVIHVGKHDLPLPSPPPPPPSHTSPAPPTREVDFSTLTRGGCTHGATHGTTHGAAYGCEAHLRGSRCNCVHKVCLGLGAHGKSPLWAHLSEPDGICEYPPPRPYSPCLCM